MALTATGLPTGVTASFSPSSVTSGGSATLTLSTASGVAPGGYTVTIVGTGPVTTQQTTYALTVNGLPGCRPSSNATDVDDPGQHHGQQQRGHSLRLRRAPPPRPAPSR